MNFLKNKVLYFLSITIFLFNCGKEDNISIKSKSYYGNLDITQTMSSKNDSIFVKFNITNTSDSNLFYNKSLIIIRKIEKSTGNIISIEPNNQICLKQNLPEYNQLKPLSNIILEYTFPDSLINNSTLIEFDFQFITSELTLVNLKKLQRKEFNYWKERLINLNHLTKRSLNGFYLIEECDLLNSFSLSELNSIEFNTLIKSISSDYQALAIGGNDGCNYTLIDIENQKTWKRHSSSIESASLKLFIDKKK